MYNSVSTDKIVNNNYNDDCNNDKIKLSSTKRQNVIIRLTVICKWQLSSRSSPLRRFCCWAPVGLLTSNTRPAGRDRRRRRAGSVGVSAASRPWNTFPEGWTPPRNSWPTSCAFWPRSGPCTRPAPVRTEPRWNERPEPSTTWHGPIRVCRTGSLDPAFRKSWWPADWSWSLCQPTWTALRTPEVAACRPSQPRQRRAWDRDSCSFCLYLQSDTWYR